MFSCKCPEPPATHDSISCKFGNSGRDQFINDPAFNFPTDEHIVVLFTQHCTRLDVDFLKHTLIVLLAQEIMTILAIHWSVILKGTSLESLFEICVILVSRDWSKLTQDTDRKIPITFQNLDSWRFSKLVRLFGSFWLSEVLQNVPKTEMNLISQNTQHEKTLTDFCQTRT
jgi:hypothetical protein